MAIVRINLTELRGCRRFPSPARGSLISEAIRVGTCEIWNSDGGAVVGLDASDHAPVPMASTVLTVSDPSHYAVIDYRAFRGLAGAKPDIIDSSQYAEYAEFVEHFRTYLRRPAAYGYYMDHVRGIAEAEELSAREVDMALWAYIKGAA